MGYQHAQVYVSYLQSLPEIQVEKIEKVIEENQVQVNTILGLPKVQNLVSSWGVV